MEEETRRKIRRRWIGSRTGGNEGEEGRDVGKVGEKETGGKGAGGEKYGLQRKEADKKENCPTALEHCHTFVVEKLQNWKK
jgi:hypothetical protein